MKTSDHSMKKPKFFHRRNVVVPTFLGCLTLLGLALSFIIGILLAAPAVLQINQPVATKVLVAEGWMNRSMMQEVVKIFRDGDYKLILVTGGLVTHDPQEHVSGAKTYAEQGAWNLRSLGLDANKVIAIPPPMTNRNRTSASADVLFKWLQTNEPNVHEFNLVTDSIHSRRSFWLYRAAAPQKSEIGILPIADPHMTFPWWKSSYGFKKVIMELISLLYTVPFILAS